MSQQSPTSPNAIRWLIIEPLRRFSHVRETKGREHSQAHAVCEHWLLPPQALGIAVLIVAAITGLQRTPQDTSTEILSRREEKHYQVRSWKQTIWSCSFFIPQHIFCQFHMDDFQSAQKWAFHRNSWTWQVGSVKIIFSRCVNEQKTQETGNSYPQRLPLAIQ